METALLAYADQNGIVRLCDRCAANTRMLKRSGRPQVDVGRVDMRLMRAGFAPRALGPLSAAFWDLAIVL